MPEDLTSLVTTFPPGFWTIFGFVLLFTRMIFLQSRMLIYSGLGALTLAILASYKFIEWQDFFMQFLVFALSSLGWAIVFLFPFLIKDYFDNRYRYLKGAICEISKAPLVKGQKGYVLILGKEFEAIMQSDSGIDTIAKGEEARIVKVKGSTLIVAPTSIPLPSKAELQGYREHLKNKPLRSE